MQNIMINDFQLLEIPKKGAFRLIPEEDYKQLILLIEAAKLLNSDNGDVRIGEVIINYRKKKSLSQKELAQKSGVTAASLCNVENGKIKKPRRRTLTQLIRVLGPEFEKAINAINSLK